MLVWGVLGRTTVYGSAGCAGSGAPWVGTVALGKGALRDIQNGHRVLSDHKRL